MGRGIVYCGDCGKRLLDGDFDSGSAQYLNDIPYCTECRAPVEPPPQQTRLPSSGRWKAIKKRSSSRSLPIVPPDPEEEGKERGTEITRRRAPRTKESSRLMLISGTLVGVAVVVLLVIVMFGGGGDSQDAPPPARSSAPAPRPTGSSSSTASRTLSPAAQKRLFDKLASFARTSQDPDEILFKCDEAKKKLGGTAYIAQIKGIETRAFEMRKKRDGRRKFEFSLAEVKKMISEDDTFRRENEVVRLLESLLPMAGAKRSEVEAILSNYQADRVLGRIRKAEEIRDADKALEKEQDVFDLLDAAYAVGGPHEMKAKQAVDDYTKYRVDARVKLAREIRAGDPGFEREADVRELLEEAMELEGASRPRLEKELADYRKAMVEALRGKRLGPFAPQKDGYIRNWLVLGPFPNDGDRGYDRDYLKSEAAADPGNRVPVFHPGLPRREWRAIKSATNRVKFGSVFGGMNHVVCYAACWVEVDSDQDAEIWLGSDDGFKLWVDGREVAKDHTHRPCAPDSDKVPVRLTKGRHLILLKVDNGDGDYEFMLRVMAPGGASVVSFKILN